MSDPRGVGESAPQQRVDHGSGPAVGPAIDLIVLEGGAGNPALAAVPASSRTSAVSVSGHNSTYMRTIIYRFLSYASLYK